MNEEGISEPLFMIGIRSRFDKCPNCGAKLKIHPYTSPSTEVHAECPSCGKTYWAPDVVFLESFEWNEL